jgi:hypothetical protein
MNYRLVFFLTGMILIGCKDNNDDEENYFIKFQPRKCTHINLISEKRVGTIYNDVVYYDYTDIEDKSTLKANDYVLALFTTNGLGEEDFDTSLPELEKEIEINYKQLVNSRKSKSIGGNNTKVYTSMIDIRYRIDGVKSLTISSLDAPLFGKPIGTSLNQYFEIFNYDPDFIASYEIKRLVYGFTDTDKPTAIDEWLSLSPMAQPSMFLRINAEPENLPVTLRFKVDMETTDGIFISDTTKVFTLTN